MNFTSADVANLSRVDHLPSHRQGRFLGPLLGFFLASIFPNLAIARLQQGSIRFQYDPVPLIRPNQPPSITIYQSLKEPATTNSPEVYQTEPIDDYQQHIDSPILYPDIVPTNIESPSEYLIPAQSQNQKVTVKRAISSRYLTAYRRNRYNTRKRFPEYLEYDHYDYLTSPRLRNRKRNQGRRPTGFDYDYDYDYDYGKGQSKRKQQRRRIKNKNRKEPEYYSDEEFGDEVERVTPELRPRQQQTTPETTTRETTTMPSTTLITNGSTPSTTTTTNGTTGYGYGPYSGNENISITYGPPSAIKPVYGVPGSVYGAPLSDWVPSSVYESPSSYYSPGSYYSPSTSYGSPSISYGSPGSSSGSSYSPSISYGSPSVSYAKPYATQTSYGPPSTSYGVPSQSYGIPNQFYGAPNQQSSQPAATPGARATSYQNYQLPFSSWYGRSATHSDIVKRVQDIIRYD